MADILREARPRNSTVTLDPDFADLEDIISRLWQPWNPPSPDPGPPVVTPFALPHQS